MNKSMFYAYNRVRELLETGKKGSQTVVFIRKIKHLVYCIFEYVLERIIVLIGRPMPRQMRSSSYSVCLIPCPYGWKSGARWGICQTCEGNPDVPELNCIF